MNDEIKGLISRLQAHSQLHAEEHSRTGDAEQARFSADLERVVELLKEVYS